MPRKFSMAGVASMPKPDCRACHGIGSVGMTAHFYTGDHEFEAPCWECFGADSAIRSLPKPRSTDNA
jgi:DnaJ-class molecular chaperone